MKNNRFFYLKKFVPLILLFISCIFSFDGKLRNEGESVNYDNLFSYSNYRRALNEVFTLNSNFDTTGGKAVIHDFPEDTLKFALEMDEYGNGDHKMVHTKSLGYEELLTLSTRAKKDFFAQEPYIGAKTKIDYDVHMYPHSFSLDSSPYDFEVLKCDEEFVDIKVYSEKECYVKKLVPGSRFTTMKCHSKAKGSDTSSLYHVVLFKQVTERPDEEDYVYIRIWTRPVSLSDFFVRSDIKVDHSNGDRKKEAELRLFDASINKRRLEWNEDVNIDLINWNYDLESGSSKVPLISFFSESDITLSCYNCYLYCGAGFVFEMRTSWFTVEYLRVGRYGDITTRFETYLTASKGNSFDDKGTVMGKTKISDIWIWIEFLPLIFDFYIGVGAEIFVSVSADITMSHELQYIHNSSVFFVYDEKDHPNGTIVQNTDIREDFGTPQIHLNGELDTKFSIIPYFSIEAYGILGVSFSLSPYVSFGLVGDTDQDTVVFNNIEWGIDLRGRIDPIEIFSIEIIKGFPFADMNVYRANISCEFDSCANPTTMFMGSSNPIEPPTSDQDLLKQNFGNTEPKSEMHEYCYLHSGMKTEYMSDYDASWGITSLESFSDASYVTLICQGDSSDYCNFTINTCSGTHWCGCDDQVVFRKSSLKGGDMKEFFVTGSTEFFVSVGVRTSSAVSVEMLPLDPFRMYKSSNQLTLLEEKSQAYLFIPWPSQLVGKCTDDFDFYGLLLVDDDGTAIDQTLVFSHYTVSGQPSYLIKIQVFDSNFRKLTQCSSKYKTIIPQQQIQDFLIPFPSLDGECKGGVFATVLLRGYAGTGSNAVVSFGMSVLGGGFGVKKINYDNEVLQTQGLKILLVPPMRWKYDVIPIAENIFFQWKITDRSVYSEHYLVYTKCYGHMFGCDLFDPGWDLNYTYNLYGGLSTFPTSFSEFLVVGMNKPVDDWCSFGDKLESIDMERVFDIFSGMKMMDFSIPTYSSMSSSFESQGYVYVMSNNDLEYATMEFEVDKSDPRDCYKDIMMTYGFSGIDLPSFSHCYVDLSQPFSLPLQRWRYKTSDYNEFVFFFVNTYGLNKNCHELNITFFARYDLAKEGVSYDFQIVGTDVMYFSAPHESGYNCYHFTNLDKNLRLTTYYNFQTNGDLGSMGSIVKGSNFVEYISTNSTYLGIGAGSNAGYLAVSYPSKSFEGVSKFSISVSELEICKIDLTMSCGTEELINFDYIKSNGMKVTLDVSSCGNGQYFSKKLLRPELGILESLLKSYTKGNYTWWNTIQECFFKKVNPLMQKDDYSSLSEYLTFLTTGSNPTKVEMNFPGCEELVKVANNAEKILVDQTRKLSSDPVRGILQSNDDRTQLKGSKGFMIMS